MARVHIPLLGIWMAAGLLLAAPPAAAYVQYHHVSGEPLRWCRPEVAMTVYNGQPLPQLSSADMAGAAAASLHTWSASGVSHCSTALQLTLEESSQSRPRVAYDRHNVIIFRSDGWNWEGPTPSDGSDPDLDYDPSALALTTLMAQADGRIVDADVEVNATNFTWVWSDSPGARQQDLQNTLTHEIGHVIGLDHTCWGGRQKQPVDNLGNPVPACPLPAGVPRTTMYPSANARDVSMRILSDDEQQAVCDIYAPGAPVTCPDEGCGCRVQSAGAAGVPAHDVWPALVVLGAALLVRARRWRT